MAIFNFQVTTGRDAPARTREEASDERHAIVESHRLQVFSKMLMELLPSVFSGFKSGLSCSGPDSPLRTETVAPSVLVFRAIDGERWTWLIRVGDQPMMTARETYASPGEADDAAEKCLADLLEPVDKVH